MVGVQEIMTAAEFLHSKRDSHELGDNLTNYLRNRNGILVQKFYILFIIQKQPKLNNRHFYKNRCILTLVVVVSAPTSKRRVNCFQIH